MTRREVKVQIHAWLEVRDFPGLQRAFRARLTHPAGTPIGVGSREEMHRALDRILRGYRLIDEEVTSVDGE